MKIIQIIPNFAVAGAEVMAENLIYELRKKGCEVIAISQYSQDSEITKRLRESGVQLIFLNKKRGFDILQFWKLYKILKKEKPDVVHTHLYSLKYVAPTSILAGVSAKVHTIHNIAIKECGKFSRIINGLYFRLGDVVPVSLTEEIQLSVISEYNIAREKTPVVYNGMPIETYLPKKDYSTKEIVKILHVGRFSAQKNHKRLIEAFEIICKKHPKTKLLLAGTGELMGEVENLVKDKGLQENVNFLGLCTNMKELMNEADIFCLPSDYEGMPMTLIEAMATALPIVATNVGGIPDMIQNGVEGILCECNNDSVAKALMAFIEDETLRQRMGQTALLKSKNYSSKNMSEKYIELYEMKIRDRG